MSSLLIDPNAWAALLTLTALEIVLGIDNVVFVSLLAANLDAASGRPRVKSDLRSRLFSGLLCCSLLPLLGSYGTRSLSFLATSFLGAMSS